MYSGLGVDTATGLFDAAYAGLGKHLIVYTYVDLITGCSDTAQDSIVVENCYIPYCSYTQGFWGSANGKANTCDSTNGLTTLEIIKLILKDTSVVIGDPAASCSDKWRSFTMYEKDSLNILAVLPAGGPSKVLDPVRGRCNGSNWTTMYNTVFTSASGGAMSPAIKTKKNKPNIANTLLGQAMALSLNTLYDTTLSSLVIAGDTIHTEKSLDCDSGRFTPAGSPQTDVLPASLRTYFGGGYTVAQLLALANNALSGKYVPSGGDPSLGDLASALGTINEAFDECRLLIEFTSPSVSSSSPNPGPNQNANTSTNTSANNSTASVENGISVTGFKVISYPNPFSESITVRIESILRETAVVEIYDVHGKLIQSTEKDCMRGVNQVELETMSLIEGVYFIKVKLGAYETYTRILKMDK